MRTPFTELVDLASESLGGVALAASDEFFAPKENLLKPGPAVFIPDKFTEFGKWMDGWESRRKRGPGHDWCVIRLGIPGAVAGVCVDTTHFLGNYPEYCSIDATAGEPPAAAGWTEILPKVALRGGTENLFAVSHPGCWKHLRLNIYPDGGVARFRVHGIVKPDWKSAKTENGLFDLAAVENGGTVISCADMFFGPKDNLVLPGRPKNMGGGWETRRRRGPGNDWIIVRLGAAGKIRRVEVDTAHFKGNFPESCSLDGLRLPGSALLPCDFRDRKDLAWEEILPRTKLQADHRHFFEKELHAKTAATPFDYVRLQIYPDGGVGRLRVYGELA